VTALGPPALLERTSTSLLTIRDLFARFDTGVGRGQQNDASLQPCPRAVWPLGGLTAAYPAPSTLPPPAASAFASSAGRQRTLSLLSPRALPADGNGQVTKDEFAQVYSQLFVDDAPERIDEVGSIYSIDIDIKLNPLHGRGRGGPAHGALQLRRPLRLASLRSASCPRTPTQPRLALPPLAPGAVTAPAPCSRVLPACPVCLTCHHCHHCPLHTHPRFPPAAALQPR
jgi:hypothetical protein